MTYRRLVHPVAAMLLVACTILFYPTGSSAQDTKGRDILLPQIGTGSVDAYIEALRSDIRTHMRRIVEVNMQLTEKEAAAFWPIYDRYDNDMSKLNFERSSIYGFYADNYRTLTDEQARDLIRRMNYVDRRKLSIDERYAREMAKALPVKTVLRFFQIERQVDRLVALKIMSGIPLVPPEATGARPETAPKDKPSK
jgi:hypothetical protein